jgi:hypothetical protein
VELAKVERSPLQDDDRTVFSGARPSMQACDERIDLLEP